MKTTLYYIENRKTNIRISIPCHIALISGSKHYINSLYFVIGICCIVNCAYHNLVVQYRFFLIVILPIKVC